MTSRERRRGQVLACPCGLQMGHYEAAAETARREVGLLGGFPPGQGKDADPGSPSSGLRLLSPAQESEATTGMRRQLRKS